MRPFFIIFLLSVTYLSCGVSITPATWTSLGDFPGVGRQHAVAFIFGNKAYVGLGDDGNTTFNDLWEFNHFYNTWSRKTDFPDSMRGTTFFSFANGYIMTGQDFWWYNPETDKWIKKANFPVSGLNHPAVFQPGGYAYICAGLQNGNLQKGVWRYDLMNDKWNQMKDYPGTPVEQAVGFSINQKGYITTGNKAGGKSNELWQYDPETDSWARKADFPYEVSGCVAFGVDMELNGYVGLGDLGTEFYQYNSRDNKWSKTLEFKGGNRKEAVTWTNNSQYLGLGKSDNGQFTKEMWVYRPESRAK